MQSAFIVQCLKIPQRVSFYNLRIQLRHFGWFSNTASLHHDFKSFRSSLSKSAFMLLPRHCTAIEKNTLELDTPWPKCLSFITLTREIYDWWTKDKDASINDWIVLLIMYHLPKGLYIFWGQCQWLLRCNSLGSI